MDQTESLDIQRPTTRITDVLRWMTVFPAAVLAYVLVAIFVPQLSSLERFGVVHGVHLPKSWDTPVAHLFKTSAFIFAGTMFAPRMRLKASIVLADFAIAFSFAGYLISPKHAPVFASSIVGAAIGIVGAYWIEQTRGAKATE